MYLKFLSQVRRLHSFNMDNYKFATAKYRDESSHLILLGLSKCLTETLMKTTNNCLHRHPPRQEMSFRTTQM
jgi:hypothetical protein